MHKNLHTHWQTAIANIFNARQFQTLMKAIAYAYKGDAIIYPAEKYIFNSLNYTALNSVKIVILGQDPYHGEGQAHGLAFSVPCGKPAPPSLKNIFKELNDDLGIKRDKTDLTDWAKQGVLLLNSVLTVESGRPNSHIHIGWQAFTDAIIRTISDKRKHVVFMLWGAYAQSKKHLINADKHLILTAPHPSPLSAYRGFFGCKHFSKANEYLKIHGLTPIKW